MAEGWSPQVTSSYTSGSSNLSNVGSNLFNYATLPGVQGVGLQYSTVQVPNRAEVYANTQVEYQFQQMTAHVPVQQTQVEYVQQMVAVPEVQMVQVRAWMPRDIFIKLVLTFAGGRCPSSRPRFTGSQPRPHFGRLCRLRPPRSLRSTLRSALRSGSGRLRRGRGRGRGKARLQSPRSFTRSATITASWKFPSIRHDDTPCLPLRVGCVWGETAQSRSWFRTLAVRHLPFLALFRSGGQVVEVKVPKEVIKTVQRKVEVRPAPPDPPLTRPNP